jgi:hypothetical protein
MFAENLKSRTLMYDRMFVQIRSAQCELRLWERNQNLIMLSKNPRLNAIESTVLDIIIVAFP